VDQKLIIKSIIEDLINALNKLLIALNYDGDIELSRDATIQRFEFSFELCWKLMKSVNRFLGSECFSPRDCVRLATQNELLENPEKWFDYLEKRNLVSHTYSESSAIEVYNTIPSFERSARELISKVNNKIKE